jgi:CheY-like chemotaxis protein
VPNRKFVHRVLLADDVGELRALVRLTLERSGEFVVVAEAGNGAEAVEAAAHELPDLVLLDVSMPVMDGLEALPLILEAAPDTQVVMLSGFAEERLGAEARKLGALAYLEKGVPPRELVSRLLALLQ